VTRNVARGTVCLSWMRGRSHHGLRASSFLLAGLLWFGLRWRLRRVACFAQSAALPIDVASCVKGGPLMAGVTSPPTIPELRERWGRLSWDKAHAPRQGAARSSRAIRKGGRCRRDPLLDLAQRQVGAETGTQGWLPIPVIEFVAARARHAADPRARGRQLLHHVQPGAGRPLPRPGVRHDAVHAARLRRRARGLLQARAQEGPHHRPTACSR
jgi:hypothetical protein